MRANTSHRYQSLLAAISDNQAHAGYHVTSDPVSSNVKRYHVTRYLEFSFLLVLEFSSLVYTCTSLSVIDEHDFMSF